MKKKDKKNIKALYFLAIIGFLLGGGTIFFNQTEGWSYVDSFYFSTMTLTTVGYGDLVPTTTTTKIATSLYALVGIGALIFLLTSAMKFYILKQETFFEKVVGKFRHRKKRK